MQSQPIRGSIMSPYRITSPTTSQMVERQMRNWELAKSQKLSVDSPHRPDVQDFVTLSRLVGAGGKTTALILGERLGWPVFDREILNVMAGDDDIRRQIYASMDERDLTWFEETMRAFTQPEFIRNDYFKKLTETLLALARQGSAVFLGRGADLLLPKNVGFRVRLVASAETCARNFAERHDLPYDRAKEEITRLEHDRMDFMRHHFGGAAAAADRFDLIINLNRFSATAAADLIIEARRRIQKLAPWDQEIALASAGRR
jgi:cytidylate kinase